jgi:signal transduction histidine kinase
MLAPAALRHGGRALAEVALALAAGVASFVLTALVGSSARSHVPEELFGVLVLAGVVVLARRVEILFTLPVGVAAVLAFDWYFLPPLRALDANTVLVLGTFLIMSVVVAAAATRAGRRATSSEQARGALAAEQGALRHVATLVARQATPAEVFRAVAEQAGTLLDVDVAQLFAYQKGHAALLVGTWSRIDLPRRPTDSPLGLEGDSVVGRVFRTERPARMDDCTNADGPTADYARSLGIRAAVAAPVLVEGRLWGVMTAASLRPEPLSRGAEIRIAAFAELVATAIANAQARLELRGFAEEQAALRRVATLVARAAPPEEVFAAVTAEAGRVQSVEQAVLNRYDSDGTAEVVGAWAREAATLPLPVGTRWRVGGRNVTTRVFETGRPARIDDYADATGAAADLTRERGIRGIVGAPINVEGRVWGFMSLMSTQEEPLPADTETRLAGFTELVATAIANAQARLELRGFAEEQAALRRVATLVARAAPPEEVFAAVTAEAGRLLSADLTALNRYDSDGKETALGSWSSTGALPVPVGDRAGIGGRKVTTLVFRTGRPARIDDYADSTGSIDDVARGVGIRASVGVPINVAGRLWGVMIVASRGAVPPADTETRLTGFTELVATALANAEAESALTASRARIVAAADTARRRIERDLHDGAQQRLVSLALRLRSTVWAAGPREADELRAQLDGVAAELTDVLDELREIARGLHPAALAGGGLRAALKTLARRSAVPVRLDIRVDGQLPEPVELAAYYAVAEALTNTAKHASASVVEVEAECGDGVLHVRVRDDGRGGADVTGGSGLVGLTDRMEALGGRLTLASPPGAGTTVDIELPIAASGRLGAAAVSTVG